MSRGLRPPPSGFIGPQEAAYIQLLLTRPHPKGKEAALELLCAHYRKGRRLRNPYNVCHDLTALLYDPDPSVRRWTFNAIALVGNRAQNLDATMDALERNRSDEDAFAAGMTAVLALTSESEAARRFKAIGVELEGAVLLAAAQQAPAYKGLLASRRVNPDRASPTELRLAAVLIGLDKAPEHLFTLSHLNSAVIGSLSGHSDKQVAQYAAWAACENADLGIDHLGFPPAKLRDKPEDVRKYGNRLLTAADDVAETHRDLIAEATFDASDKAREGLAIGLLSAYFSGLEEITLNWLERETNQTIREAILDHFVAHAPRSFIYDDSAKDAFRAAAPGSLLRAKLKARAEGKAIYAAFRKIELEANLADLFLDNPLLFGEQTVNKTYNVHTQQIGILGDGAKVEGGLSQTATQHIDQAQTHLGSLAKLLSEAGTDERIEAGKQLTAEANAKPTRGAVERLLAWMTTVKTASGLVIGGAEDFSKIAEKLHGLLPYLPS